MTTDTTPSDDVGPVADIDDAQISEIVEQELATAVADPDPVYVLSVEFEGDGYTSVHTSREGADARLVEIAAGWGVADALDSDRLVHSVTKVPLETP
ncbi:hypothetical protein MMAD_44340 [Mycolicibacterium madagascariense]|uniref:Uncharacterized protein n=1 Tax=Mycolicibacterium madagascariense TaxID=212765 RepID=A0A7I7XLN2_9MYCO|nr:hypothetical protein [Mycolicibacterium madagascariense]MCV7012462.1 hypothetical protein [Mycolicibacterium madagascariense]BBZ30139.1 hypothetical protein MMAD_44340 [Mycolicibacterium madagascariense]